MAPKKSRSEIEDNYLKAITAMKAKQAAFIPRYESVKLYGRPDQIAAVEKEFAALQEEESQITDQYFADIAESDDPTPPSLPHGEPGQGNVGNYD